jgi:Polysaccharide lyase
MLRVWKVAVLLLLMAIVATLGARALPLHVYDGFESARLSRLRWSRYRFAPGAVASESDIVRSGQRALAITVHSRDCFERGVDGSASTERAELMEAWWLFSRSGRTYAYAFSLYLPIDFPQTKERLVLAQWRQLCEARKCQPDRPVLAIRYEEGRIQVTRQNQDEKVILYQGSEDVRGKWMDFRFVARFDSSNDGSVDATLDGQKIVSYRGPTLFQPAAGYPRSGLVYFKTGLYRDALGKAPWTIYVDEYRKDQCPSSGCE